jgi:hypothetical protein
MSRSCVVVRDVSVARTRRVALSLCPGRLRCADGRRQRELMKAMRILQRDWSTCATLPVAMSANSDNER